jgi:hypothetical protein
MTEQRLVELDRKVNELAIRTATDIVELQTMVERAREDRLETERDIRDLNAAVMRVQAGCADLSNGLNALLSWKHDAERVASGRKVSRREWMTWGIGAVIAIASLVVGILALLHGGPVK